MVKKRKFMFESMKGLVDVYLDGKKVRAEHNGETGHIYFPILESEEPEVDVAVHDSRIGIEVEIKDGKIVPFKIIPVFNKPKIFETYMDEVEAEKAHTLQRDESPLLVNKTIKRGEKPFSRNEIPKKFAKIEEVQENLGAKKP